ncbi:hypothetical protein BKA82DRAFT_17489 [Pisolithus tinctorius]|uniref:Uncharacterized protein n=1 Tax=Pisolithus tinctorius Marx 270 TaxID=870435 RepID=A0A0C3JZM0_PISTI|nr:hypothetical protein BKA82DRAFT_17489 [Pisolithus tinctorius]KIO14608.1 hypothetical protein M404DRAFT_17489 [Pisolithus tinctorius Marx 270]
MSSHLTPPPSSPQSHHLNTSRHCSKSPPLSPLRTSKTQRLFNRKIDTGITPLPSTPLPKHLPERNSLQETLHISRSVEKGPTGDHSGDYLATSLPPTVHRLLACAKQARNKCTPYQKPRSASSIELRFTEKSLGRQTYDGITLEDVRVGKSLLMCGLESARLCALMTAWELEAINCQREFLLMIQEENMQKFLQSTDDLWLFMSTMEHCSVNELKHEADFEVRAYGQDLTLLALEDECLAQMEEVSGERGEREAADSEDDLLAILAASITVDALQTDGSEHSDSEDDS